MLLYEFVLNATHKQLQTAGNKKLSCKLSLAGLNGKTMPPTKFKLYYTQSTLFWHELGHFLYPNITAVAIRLENEFRGLYKNLNPRPYDSHHPQLQLLDDNWNYFIFEDLYKP